MPRIVKEARLNLRVSQQEKELIAKAAAIKQRSATEFIVKHAYEAACDVLAEQTNFRLNNQEWEKFCRALDAPTRDVPALKNLLTTPGVFDE
jgi:uncharacterized protein (DUF1778 family)